MRSNGRYLAEQQITSLSGVKKFAELGYLLMNHYQMRIILYLLEKVFNNQLHISLSCITI